jgi:anti-sigma factor RsiW
MNTFDEHPRGALHAYLDGELSLEGSLEVEAHLAECGVCRRELETFQSLRRLLRSAKSAAPEAETALARVTRSVRVRRRRTFALGGVGAMAAAALVALMVVPKTSEIVQEVAAVHARALDGGHSVALASDDPTVLGQWLSKQLPGAVHPTAGGDGFALRGARVDSLEGRQVATVVYQVRNHLVDVFAWPSDERDMEPRPSVAGRWTVCRWSHAGVAYWMVSDAGTDDLKALAALIKEQRT